MMFHITTFTWRSTSEWERFSLSLVWRCCWNGERHSNLKLQMKLAQYFQAIANAHRHRVRITYICLSKMALHKLSTVNANWLWMHHKGTQRQNIQFLVRHFDKAEKNVCNMTNCIATRNSHVILTFFLFAAFPLQFLIL